MKDNAYSEDALIEQPFWRFLWRINRNIGSIDQEISGRLALCKRVALYPMLFHNDCDELNFNSLHLVTIQIEKDVL